MTGENNESEARVSRRGYLGLIASTAAVTVGAAQTGRGAEGGYGTNGYGTDPYGGDGTDSGGETETALDVRTAGTSDVGAASATLVGQLSQLQGYESATVSFEWGTAGSQLFASTAGQTLGATGEFAATLSELDSDTEYEFRAVATADGEKVADERLSFRTDPVEGDPTVESLAGADVSDPQIPYVNAELEWSATIDSNELDTAMLMLSDADGVIESWIYELSGQSASATETTWIMKGVIEEGTEYSARLIVYSSTGNIDQQTTAFEAQ